MSIRRQSSGGRIQSMIDLSTNTDISAKFEDGVNRWIRGVSQPDFLVAPVCESILIYVAGCHIKYLKLEVNPSRAEVVRIIQPKLGGIKIIEGNPSLSIYAVAESCRKPRILIYQYEKVSNTEVVLAELKGSAEYDFRCVKFSKSDILLALVGVPEFTVCIWRWTTQEELVVVKSLEHNPASHLALSVAYEDYWIEWSRNYITFYELQAFTENNVIRTEILLPANLSDLTQADERRGVPTAIDIVDVVWTAKGDFYLVDTLMDLYGINMGEKMVFKIGRMPLGEDVKITGLYSYEYTFMATTSNGFLQVMHVDSTAGIRVGNQIKLSGNALRVLSFCVDESHVTKGCFYCISDNKHRIDVILEGRLKESIPVLDFIYSKIVQVTFLEPNAIHFATLSLEGEISIWETQTGKLVTKWKLPIFATAVESHPILPFVACGTDQGTLVILDIENVLMPKIIYRGYLNDTGVISRVDFLARGKFLICGEESTGKIFLQYGFPSLHFLYLDNCDLGSRICHVNVPTDHKDLRVQIITQGHFDEIPSALHNFRLDKDQLELVASQAFDAPITTLCFSSFKRLSYSYSCEGKGIGFVPFTDDMQAGSLKEPELQFNFDFALDINRIQMRGSKFYTFGQDGHLLEHEPPVPKHAEAKTYRKVQTHYWARGGITDGRISQNGCYAVAIGADETLVVVTLNESENAPPLELGSDYQDVEKAQLKRLAKIQLQTNIALSPEEKTLVALDAKEREEFAKHKYQKETKYVIDGIQSIKTEMAELLEQNGMHDEDERLELEEFELDSDEEEILAAEFGQDRAIAEVEVTSTIEERQEWIKRMKDMVWDLFAVKGSRIISFHGDIEVSNYPLPPVQEDTTRLYKETRSQRRFEKQMHEAESEISRIGTSASVNVLQFVMGGGGVQKEESVDSLQRNLGSQNAAVKSSMGLLETQEAEEHDVNLEGEEALIQEGGDSDRVSKTSGLNLSRHPSGTNEKVKKTSAAMAETLKRKSKVEEMRPKAGSKEEEDKKVSETVIIKAAAAGPVADTEQGAPPTKSLPTLGDPLEIEAGGEDEEAEEEEESSNMESDSDPEDEFSIRPGGQVVKTIVSNSSMIPAESSEKSTDVVASDDVAWDLRMGTRSYKYINPNSLMYDQLEVSARHHTNQQIVLIQKEIRRLKEYFNGEFQEIKGLKEAEMKAIQERNARMREIAGFFDVQIDIEDPVWDPREDIGNALNVRDDEIAVERYYTEEERAEMERRRLSEEARRLALQDDFRERALMIMMDGVLERRQEEILKKDIPKLPFMLLKEEWEWTSDEYKAAEEYNKKVAELEVARESLKKDLENEMKGLLKTNSDSKKVMDDRIKELWLLKVNIEACIRTEEVKLCRMVKHILEKQLMDAEERRLSMVSKKLQESVKSSQNLAGQLMTLMEHRSKQYELLTDRERILEKTFQRDLGEVGHFYDFFTRLYKKYPKLTGVNEKSPEFLAAMIKALQSQDLRQFSAENGEMESKIAKSLIEFDDVTQSPTGCPRAIWDRFVVLRKYRMLCEYEIKAAGIELLGLKKALGECRIREVDFESAIESILTSLSNQRDAKLASVHNFEFQLNLLQGQVELPQIVTRRDFDNSLLLKKKFIEVSNHFIKKYGSVKLSAMERNNSLHRKIKQWEWRFKHATLNKKNLVEKYNDINTIKATKDILNFIKQGRNFKKMQDARLRKIKELQSLAERYHARFMESEQHLIKATTHKELVVKTNNEEAEKTIFTQNIQVNEARLMCNLVGTGEEQKDHMRRRLDIIIQTGRIMRRISRNAEEIVLLENELDKQYRRTYPVL